MPALTDCIPICAQTLFNVSCKIPVIILTNSPRKGLCYQQHLLKNLSLTVPPARVVAPTPLAKYLLRHFCLARDSLRISDISICAFSNLLFRDSYSRNYDIADLTRNISRLLLLMFRILTPRISKFLRSRWTPNRLSSCRKAFAFPSRSNLQCKSCRTQGKVCEQVWSGNRVFDSLFSYTAAPISIPLVFDCLNRYVY